MCIRDSSKCLQDALLQARRPDSGHRIAHMQIRVPGHAHVGDTRVPTRRAIAHPQHTCWLHLFHPDCTVGPGITPGLLTPDTAPPKRFTCPGARGLCLPHHCWIGTLTAGREFHPALRSSLFLNSMLPRRRSPVLCVDTCLLYTSPSPRDRTRSRMPSSA
eukprot:TRINITY_DN2047_c0_g1_i2.p2 TRINITY_DN2047_c0_g1~~TRINITY_DN2047_c0_g1_i2.p2  ORF type:complete len:160 (-),score=19.19 TRINITY_DN2047_c0_g1_i2:83-562(-)